jgi:hypothetical protein
MESTLRGKSNKLSEDSNCPKSKKKTIPVTTLTASHQFCHNSRSVQPTEEASRGGMARGVGVSRLRLGVETERSYISVVGLHLDDHTTNKKF